MLPVDLGVQLEIAIRLIVASVLGVARTPRQKSCRPAKLASTPGRVSW